MGSYVTFYHPPPTLRLGHDDDLIGPLVQIAPQTRWLARHREPLPPKPKRKHKKRYQRLRNQAQALEAQANQTRFRKQIDIRTFAYHVG
jgi:hypothetical protein